MLVKNGRDLFVPSLEFFQHLVQNVIDLGIGESSNAVDDLTDTRFAAGVEWPGNYPANVVYKPDRQALNLQRFTTGVLFSVFHSCHLS